MFKDLLIERGVKQVVLSSKSGVSQSRVSLFASGYFVPTVNEMNKLCKCWEEMGFDSAELCEVFSDKVHMEEVKKWSPIVRSGIGSFVEGPDLPESDVFSKVANQMNKESQSTRLAMAKAAVAKMHYEGSRTMDMVKREEGPPDDLPEISPEERMRLIRKRQAAKGVMSTTDEYSNPICWDMDGNLVEV